MGNVDHRETRPFIPRLSPPLPSHRPVSTNTCRTRAAIQRGEIKTRTRIYDSSAAVYPQGRIGLKDSPERLQPLMSHGGEATEEPAPCSARRSSETRVRNRAPPNTIIPCVPAQPRVARAARASALGKRNVNTGCLFKSSCRVSFCFFSVPTSQNLGTKHKTKREGTHGDAQEDAK